MGSNKLRFSVIGLAALLVVAIACSSNSDQPAENTSTASSDNAASNFIVQGNRSDASSGGSEALAGLRVDERPLVKGPLSPDGVQAIFATPDLGVGENRIGFVVTTQNGLVRVPAAIVTSFYLGDSDESQGEQKETVLAVFRVWPYATRGLYTTKLNFDQPGRWKMDINVLDAETGTSKKAEVSFDVATDPETLAVGVPAIASKNKTIHDAQSIKDLTTGSIQDPDLYQTTIADAITSGKPTVIVMASPAFCTNAVCGPQVQVLSDLEEVYKGQANFIHIDLYDNPEGIQGDLNNAILSPVIVEWNLPSTEWSWVIDRDGNIASRFESFATFNELEKALKDAL